MVNDDSVAKVDNLTKAVQKLHNQNIKLSTSMKKELLANLEEVNGEISKLEKEQFKLIKSSKNLTKAEEARAETIKANLGPLKSMSHGMQSVADKNKAAERSGISLTNSFRNNFPKVDAAIKITSQLISGGLTLGTLGAVAAFELLVATISFGFSQLGRLYNTWMENQRLTIQGMAELSMATGASAEELGNLSDVAEGMRSTFSGLGGSVSGIQESLAWATQLAPALRDVRLETEEVSANLLEMTRGFGISVTDGVALMRDLSLGMFGTRQTTDEFGADMIEFAEQIGIHAGQLVQDFAASRSEIARFGRDGMQAFRNASTMARLFGMDARTILDMARQFNTFGQASDSVNTLNSMLGTTISSFDLMMEQDPAARIEMLRRAIEDSGTAWEDMDQYQRTAIAQTLGQSEEVAARLFMEHTTLAQLEREREEQAAAQAARDEQALTDQQTMHNLLNQTSTLFMTWQRNLEIIANDLSQLLAPLFGEVYDSSVGISGSIAHWVHELSTNDRAHANIQRLADILHSISSISTTIGNIWESTVGPTVSRFIDNWLSGTERILSLLERLTNPLSSVEDRFRSVGAIATGLTGHGAASLALSPPTTARTSTSTIIESLARTRVTAGEDASVVSASLRQTFGAQTISNLEKERGESFENFVTTLAADEVSGDSVEPSVGPDRLSATSTSPSTDRTATASSRGSSEPVVIVTPVIGRVVLDGRDIGRVFVEGSARA